MESRTALPAASRRTPVEALAWLGALAAAEAGAVFEQTLGLALFLALLAGLLGRAATVLSASRRALLVALALVPLSRLYEQLAWLVELPPLAWLWLTGLVLLAATAFAARQIGYSRADLGLALSHRRAAHALLVLPLGPLLGALQYLALQPPPLLPGAEPWELALATLVLLVSAGLAQELLFRGLLQRAAIRQLGPPEGLLYATTVYAVMHVGTLAPLQVGLAFGLGLLFALLTQRSGSLLPAITVHAVASASLLLLWPRLLGPTPVEPPAAQPPAAAATPAPLPTAPSPPAAAPASPTPAPSPSPPGGQPAEIVVVQGTDGLGAVLRSGPGRGAPELAVLAEYTPLVVLGPDRSADGIRWRPVRAPSGAEGWIAATLVTPGRERAPAPAR